MSEPVTLEDIYQIFRTSAEEFDRRLRESDRRLRESDRRIEQARLESDRRIEQAKLESERRIEEARLESERRAEEARLESERRAEEIQNYRAETARILAEAKLENDRTIAELKRTVEQTNRAVNSLTTRWGRFVEELVQPAVLRLFQEKGIDIKEIYPRARVKRQGIAMEIDILAVDDTDVVLVECKSRLSKDDVDEFLEKLTRFKIAFPHYKNYQAYGAV
ncbi:MAG: DUF3782 domain-containing protein [Microcystis aeruginosa W11-03]|nr:DUF3782 domain-containing protein [Microcystis aeruginosa W11-03]